MERELDPRAEGISCSGRWSFLLIIQFRRGIEFSIFLLFLLSCISQTVRPPRSLHTLTYDTPSFGGEGGRVAASARELSYAGTELYPGYSFDIQSIGINTKMAKIFHTATVPLPPKCSFVQCRTLAWLRCLSSDTTLEITPREGDISFRLSTSVLCL